VTAAPHITIPDSIDKPIIAVAGAALPLNKNASTPKIIRKLRDIKEGSKNFTVRERFIKGFFIMMCPPECRYDIYRQEKQIH
jgi:hypothetical protein